jgi:glycerol-3-phosphate dehydrogenase
METQVVIIGGGIIGTAVARELSQYNVDVTLVEKRADVSMGVSKCSNSLIYSPLAFSWVSSGALKRVAKETKGAGAATKEAELMKDKLCIDGANLWDNLIDELDLEHIKFPYFVIVATSEGDLKVLELMEKEAQAHSCYYKSVDKQDLFSLEPNLTKEALAGLIDDKWGYKMFYPWEAVIGLAEVAQQNGVKLMLNTEVTGFSKSNGFQIVETTSGPIKTEFIINATGGDGAGVAAMADACDFRLQYFKGCLIIGDKNVGGMVNGWITSVPRPGILRLVHPLPSGNLMMGLIYAETQDPYDIVVDREHLDEVFGRGQSLLPALTRKDVVSYFSMSRVFSARNPDEYIVEYAPKNPRFINTIPRLPGIVPAPAIAKTAVEMLADHGLSLTTKTDFNPRRKGIPRFSKLSNEEREKLIAQDIRYSHVICRCETVTEGEIVEAIKRGASTLDGIKFRTRAGMGRCQGGFCGPRVVDILARELNVDPTQVTKHGGNSQLLLYQGKELLEARKEYTHGSE